MDRAGFVSVNEVITVPADAFQDRLHTKESGALESGAEDKYYAPGVGLITDAEFVLVEIEKGRWPFTYRAGRPSGVSCPASGTGAPVIEGHPCTQPIDARSWHVRRRRRPGS
jgi:hypothetical protein